MERSSFSARLESLSTLIYSQSQLLKDAFGFNSAQREFLETSLQAIEKAALELQRLLGPSMSKPKVSAIEAISSSAPINGRTKDSRVNIEGVPVGFRDSNGRLFLQYCPSCDKENWAMAVASGVCAWCGWSECGEE